MTADPMADAPRNEPIEALFDGEWLEVEWSADAFDGNPYGAYGVEGWMDNSGRFRVDLEAWRYPGDPEPEPHGCPTHGHDCPGHLHWETWAEGDLVRIPSGDAITRAALNAAMVEAGGIRPQRAVVGVDLAAGSPVIVAHEDGTVSWADWERAVMRPYWQKLYADVVSVGSGYSSSSWAPGYEPDMVRRYGIDPPAPELTPPPPASGHASRFVPVAWPGYPQDELLERLNLLWRYGHPPATPDRARRAGVRP